MNYRLVRAHIRSILGIKIDRRSGVDGALWALKDVLNLRDYPCFYDDLPGDKEGYDADFKKRPLLTFDQAPKSVFAVLDFGDRVLWHFGGSIRMFGNVWKPGDYVIVKGVYTFSLVLIALTGTC